ncbi:ChaN family lipoprotein [Vreelandella aquamarina]
MLRFRRRTYTSLILCVISATAAPAILADDRAQCARAGQWWQAGSPVSAPHLLEQAAGHEVVLLGEQHDQEAHHRWQLHTLAGLAAYREDMVIGLEMLPREAQPALDAWIAGELSETAFLQQSQWHDAWGYDPALYLPILHFARMQQIPLLALNIQPSLRRQLATQGFDTIPAEERYGIPAPATASDAYQQRLRETFQHHAMGADDAAFDIFLNAQLAWDVAMADALADAAADGTLAVGLMGMGHLAYGDGVPYQLTAMGVTNILAMVPMTLEEGCTPPDENVAGGIYLLAGEEGIEPPPPRLGIQIEAHSDGVLIVAVTEDSLADLAGLQEGDVITQAAGLATQQPAELIAIVSRQAPGTLLPLNIIRHDTSQEVLVRFPPE